MNNLNNIWQANKAIAYFTIMGLILLFVGLNQSWALALGTINMSLISAIMALGVNIQWGYAGLFNVGIMGFAALGGVSVVLIAQQPVTEAVNAGGLKMLFALILGAVTIAAGFIDKIKESTKAKQGAPPGLSVVAKRVAELLTMSLGPGK